MNIFTPNSSVHTATAQIIIVVWAVLVLLGWTFASNAIPHPAGIFSALVDLWNNAGLLNEILSSLWLNIQAIAISTALSLLISYSVIVPLFRPIVGALTKLRFLGLTGLTFVFGLYLQGAWLKVALLVMGMSVFYTTSMVSVVLGIPKEQFDHARTLGMSEWRVAWEVVVLGTLDKALEILRQNAAVGWMMLTMVEGLVRSDGGIGALMLNENRHFKLDGVFALQLVILVIGLTQDYLLGWARKLICPYADLRISR